MVVYMPLAVGIRSRPVHPQRLLLLLPSVCLYPSSSTEVEVRRVVVIQTLGVIHLLLSSSSASACYLILTHSPSQNAMNGKLRTIAQEPTKHRKMRSCCKP